MTNKYEPELRFKGFKESWLNCKFNDILKTHSHKPFLAKIEEGGEYPIIQQGDKSIVGYSNNKPFPNYRDVTLFGDHTLSLYLPVSPFLLATDGLKILSVDGFEGRFLYTLLEKYLPKSEGYKRHFTILKNNDVYYPEIEERNLLGELFSKLDNIINYHKQELDNLKETKQGFLQKMFPKDGETLPEVRFLGFKDHWKHLKLGEVLESMYNGQTPSRNKKEFWNGDLNWLTSGELNRSIVKSTVEKITKLGQKDANLKIVPKGTFIIAITGLEAAGTRGNCGILDIDTTLNQSCMALFPKLNLLDTQFLFQWYRMVGENYGLRYTQGTKQQSYNAAIIKDLDICLPDIEEQIKIGNFFNKLDETIELQEKELEALKETKKAFLQKMFV